MYNIIVIVDYFVSNQPELEECYNLVPVIKNLRAEADFEYIFKQKEIKSGIQTNFNLCSKSVQSVD